MWDSEMIILLRHYIDDVEEPYKYADDRLMKLILAAASFVKNEIKFDVDYVIDLQNVTISPDPTDSSAGTRNESFINLTIMKAACLLASSGLGKNIGGISAREGPHQFDSRGRLDGKKYNVETWCSKYEKERLEYGFNKNLVAGLAIIGPYRSYVGIRDYRYNHDRQL